MSAGGSGGDEKERRRAARPEGLLRARGLQWKRTRGADPPDAGFFPSVVADATQCKRNRVEEETEVMGDTAVATLGVIADRHSPTTNSQRGCRASPSRVVEEGHRPARRIPKDDSEDALKS